jgi:hypothetical protein
LNIYDFDRKETSKEPGKPSSFEELKTVVQSFAVMADCEQTYGGAKVIVRDNAGTYQYLASGASDDYWLKKYAKKTEQKGSYTVYHFSF